MNTLTDSARLTQISKYLSFLLRHQPDAIGLTLDEHGWASIDELIAKSDDPKLSREIILLVVQTSDKQRFALDQSGQRIRANQGHSIEVELNLSPQTPPAWLYHGTAERFLPAIREQGLLKGKRHHVHLSATPEIAKAVGARYGKPVILQIPAEKMHADGVVFYQTVNHVWLTDHVPPEFLSPFSKDNL